MTRSRHRLLSIECIPTNLLLSLRIYCQTFILTLSNDFVTAALVAADSVAAQYNFVPHNFLHIRNP